MLKTLICGTAYLAGTYFIDVPVRRWHAAKCARKYADMKGKPLLNIGAGTKKTAYFGKTLYGDVNCDLNGRKDCPHGMPGVVTYADAQDLSDFDDGEFGAVLATHLLEHLPNPKKALSEWLRVVGGDKKALFVVTPCWWVPHTWLHPGHMWYATDNAGGTRGGKLIKLRDRFNPAMKKITTLRGYE
jgi:ubiquinone/menaquinone biosynthesis C-methylase UbiE